MTDLGAKEETVEFYAQFIGGRSGWDMAGIRSHVAEMRETGMDVQGVFLFDDCLKENLDEICALLQELGIGYGVLTFMNYGKTLESVDEKIAQADHAASIRYLNNLVEKTEASICKFTVGKAACWNSPRPWKLQIHFWTWN